MEELTEVITAAEFHPTMCNLFAYSSSKGTIRLCDMRQRALCDQHAKRENFLENIWVFNWKVRRILVFFFFFLVFEEVEDPTNRTFFSEIISSVSDVKFSHSGQFMLTRDYLTVKVRKNISSFCPYVHKFLLYYWYVFSDLGFKNGKSTRWNVSCTRIPTI